MTEITEFSTEAKRHMYMCAPEMKWKFLYVPELCWASSLIFVGNDPSFTDEGGGAELWQLDTTGVDTAKTQLELIESQ